MWPSIVAICVIVGIMTGLTARRLAGVTSKPITKMILPSLVATLLVLGIFAIIQLTVSGGWRG